MPPDQKEKQAPDPESIRRFQANLNDEIDGIAIYRLLAEAEPDDERRSIFEQLAAVEERHAAVWRDKLREAGVQPRERGPSLRVRGIGFLARRFGVRSILSIVRGMEAGAYSMYMAQDEAAQAIAPDEREHSRTLGRLQRPEIQPVEAIAARETWHRTGGGGTLRASIFGVSDGLVSNTALIMGFAGAQAEGQFVLLAGVAGLLAGSFSMASGEYVSMRAQRELFERQIQLERDELETMPEEEERELVLIYRAKGLPKEEAESMAARLMQNPEVALDTLVREELGLDPSALGSPWGASIGSFLAFAVGALVPVIPFFFGADASAPFVVAAAALSAVALFAVGASLSLFTGRGALLSGVRQLGLGAAAAALTFGIGSIIGVSTDV
ncbi:MAG: VIT1/CCC1 transporter family protein [Chloroflexi bacterium]|nr:VIT1/CCC1 transporter family protein [Chloroflexota bacterium]